MSSRPVLLVLCALLAACAAQVERPPGDLRVVVRFATSTDPADPALVERMTRSVGSDVRLSTQISDTEAAYWIKCTVRDPDCNDRMARLSSLPGVDGVAPDRFRYPTEPTR